ncbi:CHAT domain-containing protein [Edaphobacter dinghuensis]|uniref:CHAT domain-containing protein n=1 Tax=Edaphobacter dinghuensis TaxID=1560005 RepID=UPI001669E0CA|nr:CHAT domain-containing tetratricopeptide repeat protein [Edaphobacter dinghuensis]
MRVATKVYVILAAVCAISAAMLLHRYRITDGSSAEDLLSAADRLAWNNDWMGATPIYHRAELLFLQEHRPSQALYAHVSQMIPRADWDPTPSLLIELNQDLTLPAAQAAETRLRILTIEGMIETNYDAGIAEQTWEKVQDIAMRQGHYLLAMRAVGERGICEFFLGDLAGAKKLVLRAWIVAKYLHDPAAHVRYASVYGAGLVELHHYQEALRALDEAITTARTSPGVAYPTIAINSKIDALRGLGRYQEALALANDAIEHLPTRNLDAHLLQIMNAKGQVYEAQGEWPDAITEFSSALEYSQKLKSWRAITVTAALLAEAYEHQAQLDAALKNIDLAIDANAHLSEEMYYSPRNLAIKAEILDKMNRRAEAELFYEKSSTLINSLLATAPTQTVERDLLTEMRDVYSGAFDLLCRQGKLADAFSMIESAHGRIEAQALEHHTIATPHEPSPIESRIKQLNLELIQTDNPGVKQELEKALENADHDGDPPLATEVARSPLPLKSIQENLKPSEILLEYVLGEPLSHVVVVTNSGVRAYGLPPESEISQAVIRYEKSIHARAEDKESAALLFEQLLRPIVEYRAKTNVIVVPDGELNRLPFAALWDSSRYALVDHVFSVSPSATVLALLRGRKPPPALEVRKFVGVAASTEQRQYPANLLLSDTALAEPSEFVSIPESKREVETIAKGFGSSATVLVGQAATLTTFSHLPLDQYQVIHLALHGYANVQFPDQSALVFVPDDKDPTDGRLTVQQVRRMHLRATLVTLSACNTGDGPIGEADVANLGNAFLEAGADSVVMSLWELEDRSTELLMTSFYNNLEQGKSKAEALRNAQLMVERKGLMPYYWASVELVGDPSQWI